MLFFFPCFAHDHLSDPVFARFCRAIRAAFEQEFLRHPTQEEIDRYTQLNARRGLPSMFGSIDCSGWIWKNTPMAHQGARCLCDTVFFFV
jgi:hypothetical protein